MPCDAGTYTCHVTNTLAPLLTLKSRTITVTVTGNVPTQNQDTTICFGKTLRLPSGRIVSTSGNYSDTTRSIRRCDSLISTVRLTVNSNATTTTQNPTICNGQTYTLPNGQVVSVTTNFRDTLRNRNGCDSVIRVVNLTVNPVPTISSSMTLSNIICGGQNNGAISLNITGGTPNYAFNWSGPNGFSSTIQNISNLKKGGYTLTVTDSKNCKTMTNILTISEPDSLLIGTSNVYPDSCQRAKGSIIIDSIKGGNGGNLFSWSNATTRQNLRNITAGTYTLTVRDSRNCTTTASFSVSNKGGTTAAYIAKTLCPKDSFQLPLSRKWLKTAGTFNDTTRNQFGCDSIIPYQIGFQQQPDAVDDALEIPLNTTESVIDVLKNDRFSANLIDILIRRQLSVGTLEVQSLGVYNVKMPRILKNPISFSYQICSKTCPNLCDSATVTITMKGETTLGKIQTLITPNGDGKNDVLDFPEIDWSKYPNNEMEIFNRWGQRIYYAKPYNTHRWEGKNEQGLELPEGDYFLILRLGLAEGNILVGTVYLQR